MWQNQGNMGSMLVGFSQLWIWDVSDMVDIRVKFGFTDLLHVKTLKLCNSFAHLRNWDVASASARVCVLLHCTNLKYPFSFSVPLFLKLVHWQLGCSNLINEEEKSQLKSKFWLTGTSSVGMTHDFQISILGWSAMNKLNNNISD